MNSQIENTIKEHLVQENLQDRPDIVITPDTNLIDESVLDSLAIFSLISFLEDRFGIDIEADEVTMENFGTLRSLVALVERRQGGGDNVAASA